MANICPSALERSQLAIITMLLLTTRLGIVYRTMSHCTDCNGLCNVTNGTVRQRESVDNNLLELNTAAGFLAVILRAILLFANEKLEYKINENNNYELLFSGKICQALIIAK